VSDQDEDHGRLGGAISGGAAGPHHEHVSQAQEAEAERDLHRLPWVAPAAGEPRPEPGEPRREEKDEAGVDGLEPRRRNLEAAEHPIRTEIGEEVETRARLLEGEPE